MDEWEENKSNCSMAKGLACFIKQAECLSCKSCINADELSDQTTMNVEKLQIYKWILESEDREQPHWALSLFFFLVTTTNINMLLRFLVIDQQKVVDICETKVKV